MTNRMDADREGAEENVMHEGRESMKKRMVNGLEETNGGRGLAIGSCRGLVID